MALAERRTSPARVRTATDAELGARARRRRTSTPRGVRATARTGDWGRFGYGPGDNPIFPNMHEAECVRRGACVDRGRAPSSTARSCTRSTPPAACTTRCRHGRPGSACTTIRRSRSRGCSPGRGPRSRTSTSTSTTATASRRSSADDPRVLTISIHESREYAVPGNGRPSPSAARATPRAPRSTCRCRPARGDRRLARARSRRSVPPVVRAFAPDGPRARSSGATRIGPIRSRSCGSTAALPRDARRTLHELAHEARRRAMGRDRRRRLPVGDRRPARVDDSRSRRWPDAELPDALPRTVDRAGRALDTDGEIPPRSPSRRSNGTSSTAGPSGRSSRSSARASRPSVSTRDGRRLEAWVRWDAPGGPLPHDQASTEEHFQELEEDLHHERGGRTRREGLPRSVVEVHRARSATVRPAAVPFDERVLIRPSFDASRAGSLGRFACVDRVDVLAPVRARETHERRASRLGCVGVPPSGRRVDTSTFRERRRCERRPSACLLTDAETPARLGHDGPSARRARGPPPMRDVDRAVAVGDTVERRGHGDPIPCP